MESTLVNINGEILDMETQSNRANISVFDRSFMYGDSLYEVVRTYEGRFYEIDSHLERLERSAELCKLTLGQSLEDYKIAMKKTLDAFHKKMKDPKCDAYCRLIVSRGSGKIGFGLKNLTSPTTYVVLVTPLQWYQKFDLEKGIALCISRRMRNDKRALDPAMKSGNYLNSLLSYLDATSEGFDDALLCDRHGHVTEGTTFNIFYVRKGIVATPPLNIGILDGITRRRVKEAISKENLPLREVRFPRERLYEADEVFATSTIKEVFPVTSIDGKKIGNGKPGPLTLKIKKTYHRLALENCGIRA